MQHQGAPGSITIRPAHGSDLAAIAAIQDQSYRPALVEPAPALASRIVGPGRWSLVATTNGTVGGYLLAHRWHTDDPPPLGSIVEICEGSVLYLHDLAIAPGTRGLKVGDRLVEAAFENARSQGLKKAVLVSVDGAHTFWQRFGFQADPASASADKLASYGEMARSMSRGL